jgi:hypothetical protein
LISLLGISVIVSLVLFPITFNYLFLWENKFYRGETSDWFTLFGGITSGLIGGFFTYIALWITLNRELKKEEKQRVEKIIEINEEKERFIIFFVLKTKHYNDKLFQEFLNISNNINENYSNELRRIGSTINFRDETFEENGIYLDESMLDINQYEKSLNNIVSITNDYLKHLRESLPNFINNKEIYQKNLDLYLAIYNMNDMVSTYVKQKKFKELDFFYNFASFDVGFYKVVYAMNEDIGMLWHKYINGQDELGNFLNETKLPHVKG